MDHQRLRQYVRMHRVCYQVWPEIAYVGQERRQVGFLVELYGTHEHLRAPGSDECRDTHRHMSDLARAVIPQWSTSARCDVDAFRPIISYSQQRSMRPEVQVTLRIEHRYDYLALPDDDERRCLSIITRQLEGLGVSRGTYVEVR